MLFKAGLPGDTTIVVLAAGHVLLHALGQLVGEDVEHGGDLYCAVAAAHIRLAHVVHREAAAAPPPALVIILNLPRQEELIHFLPV